jgi:hypothetical protein
MKPGTCPLCGGRPPLFAALTTCARCALRAGDAPRAQLEPEPAQLPRDTRPIVVVLVGCGKTKQPGRHQARDLYTGSIFRAARRWAEARIASLDQDTAGAWCILSARFHDLDPAREVESYDERLAQAGDAVRWWGITTANGITCQHADHQERRAVILAGADYADAVRPHLEARGWTVVEPLRGLGTGERLAWMKHNPKEP